MSHAYRSQVFATSTWNGVQDIGTMPDAQRFTIDQARDHGIDDRQMGRAMLAEMLEG